MERPTLADVLDQFHDATGERIDPDTPLQAIENIDSLDLVEWLYEFQQQYPNIPAEESLFDDIDQAVTLRMIYHRIMETATPASRSA